LKDLNLVLGDTGRFKLLFDEAHFFEVGLELLNLLLVSTSFFSSAG